MTKTKSIIKYNKKFKIIEQFTPEFNELVEKGLTYTPTKYGNLVNLNEANSKIIEEKIVKDPSYFPFSKYIYQYIFGSKTVPSYSDPELKTKLKCVIRQIDTDNSTGEWRFHKESRISKVIDYISDSKNHFFESLKKGDIDLPDEINACADNGMPSLSSKICKYLHEYIYNKDAYFINDSYIRALALFYYEHNFGKPHPTYDSISKINKLNYKELFLLLEEIRLKACPTLKRSEFDHIIWYSYKPYVFK